MSKNIVHGDLPIHHIRVASQPTKAVRYGNGVNPFGMNAPTPTGVLGPAISQPALMHSSPTAGTRPHPDLITKVSEAEYAEATIGDKPHGTLSR